MWLRCGSYCSSCAGYDGGEGESDGDGNDIKERTIETLNKSLQEKWPLLSDLQKESILNLIDGCLREDDDEFIPELGATISEYNREIDEAVAEMEQGEFYTDEEVTALLEQCKKNYTK